MVIEDPEHSEFKSANSHILTPVATISIISGASVWCVRIMTNSVFLRSSSSEELSVSGAVIVIVAISFRLSWVTSMLIPEDCKSSAFVVKGMHESRSNVANMTALRMVVDSGQR